VTDEAQANWNVVRHVFNKGKRNVMKDRERLCEWHWKHSLQLHSKYVNFNSQQEHKDMCENWKTTPTKEATLAEVHLIQQWWKNGHVQECNIPSMYIWIRCALQIGGIS